MYGCFQNIVLINFNLQWNVSLSVLQLLVSRYSLMNSHHLMFDPASRSIFSNFQFVLSNTSPLLIQNQFSLYSLSYCGVSDFVCSREVPGSIPWRWQVFLFLFVLSTTTNRNKTIDHQICLIIAMVIDFVWCLVSWGGMFDSLALPKKI
jgi:hypothetical protein